MSDIDPFFTHTPAAGKPTVPDSFIGAFSGFFTAVASTDLLNCTAHGLKSGEVVRFSSLGTLPAPLVAGTDYYVIASGLTANAFKVSLSLGGSAIDITDTGAGAKPLFVRPLFFRVVLPAGFFTATTATDLLNCTAHGLVAGNVVRFSTLGTLPTPLAAGTDYYVIASGLTANAFKVSLTLGGTAVDITVAEVGAPYFAATIASTDLLTSVAHGLTAGQLIRFDSDGALPAGLSKATDYFVLASGLVTDAFKVALTPAGSAVSVTDAGTGNHSWKLTDAGASTHIFTSNASFTAATSDLITSTAHGLALNDKIRVASGGTLPAGLAALTDYFVIASGLTANDFKVSATLGGSAIDITTTGSGTHTWRRALSAAAAAEVTSFTNFRAPAASATGSRVPLVTPEQTLAAAILKVAEWVAYYDGSTYLTWYVTDTQARESQWAASQAAAGVPSSSATTKGAAHLLPVTGTATSVAATLVIARQGRRQVLVRNLSSNTTIKVGPAGAVVGPVLPTEALPFTSVELLQVKTDSGTADWVAYDEFD